MKRHERRMLERQFRRAKREHDDPAAPLATRQIEMLLEAFDFEGMATSLAVLFDSGRRDPEGYPLWPCRRTVSELREIAEECLRAVARSGGSFGTGGFVAYSDEGWLKLVWEMGSRRVIMEEDGTIDVDC